MQRFEDWSAFKNILCVRPDNLGDVLMTTPALRALKHAHADRRITLLTSRAGALIAKHIPEVDETLVLDPPWYRHASPEHKHELFPFIEKMARKGFDAAVIFTVFSQNPLPTAMLCYLAGIPRVAGYCRENPYALMTDWIPDKEPLYGARHEVQRQLDLVSALGSEADVDSSLSLRVSHERREAVLEILENAGVDSSKPWILLHPGASEARRRYPASSFAAAAREIVRQLNVQVVLTGSTAERELADAIAYAAGEGVVAAAGMFDMTDFITLIAMTPVIVSNNTGPVHIAAAAKTPVVVLYALTNPQHAPWRVAHRVLPFDVPAEARSRNVIVRYAGEKFFTGDVRIVTEHDIVAAVKGLMNRSDSAQPDVTDLVAVPGETSTHEPDRASASRFA